MERKHPAPAAQSSLPGLQACKDKDTKRNKTYATPKVSTGSKQNSPSSRSTAARKEFKLFKMKAYLKKEPTIIPPEIPQFQLSSTASEGEIIEFFRKYPEIVARYNNEVNIYRAELKDARHHLNCALDKPAVFASDFMNNTSWNSRPIEYVRTKFETGALLMTNFIPASCKSGFTPPYFNLTGPFGAVVYVMKKNTPCITITDRDIIYDGIKFKLTFFNFIERSEAEKDHMASGYRLQFDPEDMVQDTFHMICRSEEAGFTKIWIEFEQEDLGRKELTFIVPPALKPEDINGYVDAREEVKDNKMNFKLCYCIDIPYRPNLSSWKMIDPNDQDGFEQVNRLSGIPC